MQKSVTVIEGVTHQQMVDESQINIENRDTEVNTTRGEMLGRAHNSIARTVTDFLLCGSFGLEVRDEIRRAAACRVRGSYELAADWLKPILISTSAVALCAQAAAAQVGVGDVSLGCVRVQLHSASSACITEAPMSFVYSKPQVLSVHSLQGGNKLQELILVHAYVDPGRWSASLSSVWDKAVYGGRVGSTGALWLKLKCSKTLKGIGKTAEQQDLDDCWGVADEEEFVPSSGSDINEATFQRALNAASPKARDRYLSEGAQLRFGPDIVVASKEQWTSTAMLCVPQHHGGKSQFDDLIEMEKFAYELRAVIYSTDDIQHMKVMTEQQALQWIYFDCLSAAKAFRGSS